MNRKWIALSMLMTLFGAGPAEPLQCKADANEADLCIQAIEQNASALFVNFTGGLSTLFHYVWLRDNSDDVFDPSSGQRVRNVSQIALDIQPREVRLHGLPHCRTGIELVWPDQTTSTFSSSTLRSMAYDPASIREHDDCSYQQPFNQSEADSLPAVDFSSIMFDDKSLFEWLRNIDEHGFSLVTGMPDESGAVKRLAERIAPVSHTHLYGDTFHVKAEPGAPNIAYSNSAIPLHMDLSYYESPPGLQLLHCRSSAGSKGGETLLYDSHALAEYFRESNPSAFAALTRIPATFTKQRAETSATHNANAASMEYRRPHIDLSYTGEVKAVFWSPPFMGPLRGNSKDVIPYYEAVQAFEQLIDSDAVGLRIHFKLESGSALTFNQRRMLHGREGYNGAQRHLEGTYLNVDDFKSSLELLNTKFRSEVTCRCGRVSAGRCGNGSD